MPNTEVDEDKVSFVLLKRFSCRRLDIGQRRKRTQFMEVLFKLSATQNWNDALHALNFATFTKFMSKVG